MKITYLKVKCFLSIGTDPIIIDFTKYKNIINIQGWNHDRGGSNGSGKSTLIEAIGFGLYGKLLKGLNHKQVLNNKIKKGLEIEIRFEKGTNHYTVIRKRGESKGSLQLWINDDEWTQGSGMPDTQKEIEKIIGLSYNSFINISFFGQHNKYQFLACEPATKRHIVENLLGMEKYTFYCQNAKEKKKSLE